MDTNAVDTNAVDTNAVDTNAIVYPQRLVMIQMGDNCMFCIDQKGQTFSRYVDLDSKMGYIHCNNCKEHSINAVKVWNEKLAYGQANYLKERIINVKRSTGEIESGWILYNPVISYDIDGNEIIHCYNETQKLSKWCLLKVILEINPAN